MNKIKPLLKKLKIKRLFLIHSNSFLKMTLKNEIESLRIEIIFYGNVKPNPDYENICNAVSIFNTSNCDAIMAIGGGSVIDTAKCVKLFNPFNNSIPLIAIPTTAGSGSESTMFTVFYKNGEKQSISNENIIPNHYILIPELLENLPLFQKKCTFFDALCQAIESWWSINSTKKSIYYSKKAIKVLIKYMNDYFFENKKTYKKIMAGSNYSGKAINITQTTAAHAMSYKITTLYGIPHGYAVAICLPVIWEYMNKNIHNCTDKRGNKYLKKIFLNISKSLGYESAESAVKGFEKLLLKNDIVPPKDISEKDINLLSNSVNTERLKNTPVEINRNEFQLLYKKILNYE